MLNAFDDLFMQGFAFVSQKGEQVDGETLTRFFICACASTKPPTKDADTGAEEDSKDIDTGTLSKEGTSYRSDKHAWIGGMF
jgi:hypothetical protein